MRTGSTVPGALRHASGSVLTSGSTSERARSRQSNRTVPPVPCSSIPTAAVSGRAAASASSISILREFPVLLEIVSLVTVYSTPWYTNAASPRLPSWTVAATWFASMAGPSAYPQWSTSVELSCR